MAVTLELIRLTDGSLPWHCDRVWLRSPWYLSPWHCQLYTALLSDLSESSGIAALSFRLVIFSSEMTPVFCFTQLNVCHGCGINSHVNMLWKAVSCFFTCSDFKRTTRQFFPVLSGSNSRTSVVTLHFFKDFESSHPTSLCSVQA